MARRYTESQDGIDRCTIKIGVRLSRETVAALEGWIARSPYDNLKELLECEAHSGAERVIEFDIMDDVKAADE